MDKENPNHVEEKKDKKEKEAEYTVIDNSKLNIQDINENFLNLKNELIFFKDKSKLDEIKANLDEGTQFLKISDEIEPDDVKTNGLDFVILADVSESMYPYRIYLKKSMYFALMDIESFVYKAIESSEEFPNVRIAFVKYADREDPNSPEKLEILDFVEYTSMEQICKMIDDIEIKKGSVQKRNIFDGLKAVSELKWNEDSVKIILHLAADPQYGIQYTANPKKMGDDYDPYPYGVSGLNEDDVIEPIEALGSTFNFVALNDRLVRYQTVISSKLTMDTAAPKVVELN